MGKKNSPVDTEPLPEVPRNTPALDNALNDFIKDCEDIQAPLADSEACVAKYQFDAAFSAVCDDRRGLIKAEDTRRIYSNILYNVASGLAKDALEVQKQVEAQTKAAEELGKGFTAVVGKLKDACLKVMAAQDAADDWKREVGLNCNAATKDLIDKKLAEKGLPNLTLQAETISNQAEGAANVADTAAETAVRVAGIYTFVNIKSMKEYTDRLKSQSEEFRKDAEDNLGKANDKVKAYQKLLAEDLLKMSEAELAWRKELSDLDAVKSIVTYLQSNSKPDKTLDDILIKINTTLDGKPDPTGAAGAGWSRK